MTGMSGYGVAKLLRTNNSDQAFVWAISALPGLISGRGAIELIYAALLPCIPGLPTLSILLPGRLR